MKFNISMAVSALICMIIQMISWQFTGWFASFVCLAGFCFMCLFANEIFEETE